MEYVYQVYPTPSCPVKDLLIKLTDVRSAGLQVSGDYLDHLGNAPNI